jgi:hypothetical protein
MAMAYDVFVARSGGVSWAIVKNIRGDMRVAELAGEAEALRPCYFV